MPLLRFSLTRPLFRRDTVLFKPPDSTRQKLADLKPRGLGLVTQQLITASHLTLIGHLGQGNNETRG